MAVREDLEISTTSARIAGFQRGLAEFGVTERRALIIKVPTRRTQGASLPWRPDEAYRMATNVITADNYPDLVVTGNDFFALGNYKALRELGLSTLDYVRILRYGDHPFAAYLEPGLSTIQLPAEEVGATAVDALLRRIGDPTRARAEILLRPTPVERDSTRRSG